VRTVQRADTLLICVCVCVSLILPLTLQDPAGNGNKPSNHFVDVFTDRTNPRVVISSPTSGPSNVNLVLTAVFDETVSGLTASDVVVSSGAAANVAVRYQRVQRVVLLCSS